MLAGCEGACTLERRPGAGHPSQSRPPGGRGQRPWAGPARPSTNQSRLRPPGLYLVRADCPPRGGAPSAATCEPRRLRPCHRGADVLGHHDSWWRGHRHPLWHFLQPWRGTRAAHLTNPVCPSARPGGTTLGTHGPATGPQAGLRRAPGARSDTGPGTGHSS